MTSDYIDVFKALANEERLKIVHLLIKNKQMCARDVEKHFYLEQSTTSHHLNTLKRCGIAKSQRSGRHVFYSIDFKRFLKIINGFREDLMTHAS